jgi:N-acetylmuramoyl-L-alanine amidase
VADLVFGKAPHPEFVDGIVQKQWEGAGFLRVPPRGTGLIGTCVHSWGGGAWTTPAWKSIFDLFSPGGERHHDALVDYSVQKDGSIVRLNDPRGTRSPHANGGSDGLEGDGPAFVRKLGGAAINSRLVSIEREGGSEPMTPAQLESLAALIAYWHDQARVPWDTFPLHPALGIVTQMQHWEFSGQHRQGTGCPFAGVQGQTDAYQDRARAIMRKFQTQTDQPDRVPPPEPVDNPGHDWWPKGYTVEALKARFGGVTRIKVAGLTATTDGPHAFDRNGALSNAWVKRGGDARLTVAELPRPVRWLALSHTDPDVITYDRVEWDNGWLLERNGVRATWVWSV